MTTELLPRADEAVVPREKLERYCLDPDHEVGRHKARVFRSALGIGRDDWQYLRKQIREGVQIHPLTMINLGVWGTRYEVKIPVDGLNGATHLVTTGWFMDGDNPPRLCSAYVDVP